MKVETLFGETCVKASTLLLPEMEKRPSIPLLRSKLSMESVMIRGSTYRRRSRSRKTRVISPVLRCH